MQECSMYFWKTFFFSYFVLTSLRCFFFFLFNDRVHFELVDRIPQGKLFWQYSYEGQATWISGCWNSIELYEIALKSCARILFCYILYKIKWHLYYFLTEMNLIIPVPMYVCMYVWMYKLCIYIGHVHK